MIIINTRITENKNLSPQNHPRMNKCITLTHSHQHIQTDVNNEMSRDLLIKNKEKNCPPHVSVC